MSKCASTLCFLIILLCTSPQADTSLPQSKILLTHLFPYMKPILTLKQLQFSNSKQLGLFSWKKIQPISPLIASTAIYLLHPSASLPTLILISLPFLNFPIININTFHPKYNAWYSNSLRIQIVSVYNIQSNNLIQRYLTTNSRQIISILRLPCLELVVNLYNSRHEQEYNLMHVTI